ncbi:putative rieske domain-containing protein [Rosellinia necatrix]|uniref:Putative rieske domain-containing protein n=1 Tax=Rosellinia necatrix TaxID=77044 RepID=A0A1W2TQ07_ROSNE|nr:putative rieske domain-containing protein [Rosellinia necatrix]
MTTLPAPFVSPSREGDAWFFAGLTSSFPSLTESGADVLDEPQPCGNGESSPGCKVFHVPLSDASQAKQVEGDAMTSHNGVALQDQVLIFQYKGKIYAIDNKCPHSAFPLAKGTPFDIEDFGVVLSAGITCPKHGWSFDLFTGRADRSNYLLRRWEVQLRPVKDARIKAGSDDSQNDNGDAEEVWVRRKQRMG